MGELEQVHSSLLESGVHPHFPHPPSFQNFGSSMRRCFNNDIVPFFFFATCLGRVSFEIHDYFSPIFCRGISLDLWVTPDSF